MYDVQQAEGSGIDTKGEKTFFVCGHFRVEREEEEEEEESCEAGNTAVRMMGGNFGHAEVFREEGGGGKWPR